MFCDWSTLAVTGAGCAPLTSKLHVFMPIFGLSSMGLHGDQLRTGNLTTCCVELTPGTEPVATTGKKLTGK